MSSTSSANQPQIMALRETANDRFKHTFSSWLWGSMVAATVIHFGIFAFWPELEAKGSYGTVTEEFEMVDMPPEVVIPPPPEAIARPATPVISTADIPDDITIAPTTLESNPVDDLPPPPTPGASDELQDFQAFAPSMVRPEPRNMRDVERALIRYYPAHLRDAGIGGTVNVNFWIDETGKVVRYEVAQSSGYEAFDEAAPRVAEIMQFSPALNRNQPVRVVVTFPITFRVN